MINKESSIKWLALKNRQMAINPQTGGWLLLDDLCKELVHQIEQGLTTESISRQYEGIPASEIDRLKILLRTHNLISLKQNEKRKCKSCEKKEYPVLAVIKATLACNLKCVYCYANAGLDQSAHMSVETAHRIVDEYVRLNPNNRVTMLMHGGEPLINFKLVKDVFEYSKKYGDMVKITIQTNASLVNDEHAEFFKKNKIEVGVSLDGPACFQNATRPFQNGKGSFDHVMRGVRILQKHEVPFGVLSVMTSNVAEHIDEILDFYLANDIYTFSFIPLMKFGRGGNDSSLYVSGKQIFEAYKKIFHRIVENNTHNEKKIKERILSNMALSLFANENTFMCTQTPCGAGRKVLGLSNNGDIYICDDFIGDPEFNIGNINEAPLDEILAQSSVVAKTLQRSKNNFKRCKDCVWKTLCGGVCHAVDYYTGKDGEFENEICVFNKLMLPYLIEAFDENPQLPQLLSDCIPLTEPRNVFVALDDGQSADSIDSETFDNLLKFHDVKHYENVVLSGEGLAQNQDALDMIRLLKLQKNHQVLLLDNSKIDSPEYKKLVDCDVDEVWIKPEALQESFGAQLDQIKDLIKYKTEKNLNTSFALLLPINDELWNSSLVNWIRDNLASNDKVLLYEDFSGDSRTVLEKIRGFELNAYVSVLSSSEETRQSCSDLFVFEKSNLFFIDKETLKGRNDIGFEKILAS